MTGWDRMPALMRGDIVLTRGRARLSRLIRLMTRSPGEPPSIVNHVGIVTGAAWPDPADAMITEALGHGVVARRIGPAYPDARSIRVYRWEPADADQGLAIAERAAARAIGRIGQRYGWTKIGLQAADWLTSGGRLRLFRRLGRVDSWPICSYLVAAAYERAAFEVTGDLRQFWRVAINAATPDDLHDEVEARTDWRRVWPPIPGQEGYGKGHGEKVR